MTEKRENEIEFELAYTAREKFRARLLPSIAVSLFLTAMILFLFYIIFAISSVNQGMKDFLVQNIDKADGSYFWVSGLFIVVTAVVFLTARVPSYTRIILNNAGFIVFADKISKNYLWDEFESFSDRADHLSSWPSGSLIPWLMKKANARMGKVLFYIQYKNPTKMSPYIILETPIQFGENVRNFLKEKLTEV